MAVSVYDILYAALRSIEQPEVGQLVSATEALVRHPDLDRLVKEFVPREEDENERRKVVLAVETALKEFCAKSLEFCSLDDDGRSGDNLLNGRVASSASADSGLGKNYKSFANNEKNDMEKETLLKKMERMLHQTRKDIDQVERLERQRDSNRHLLVSAYDMYLKSCEKYVEYKVQHKNDVDNITTNALCHRKYLEALKGKLASAEDNLSSCPSREEASRRSSHLNSLRQQLTTLNSKLEKDKKRLESFKSLDPEELQELKKVRAALKEKKFVLETFMNSTQENSTIQ
jgi:hypothetical protein